MALGDIEPFVGINAAGDVGVELTRYRSGAPAETLTVTSITSDNPSFTAFPTDVALNPGGNSRPQRVDGRERFGAGRRRVLAGSTSTRPIPRCA